MLATTKRDPTWLRKKAPDPSVLLYIKSLLDELGLHSICESAECPNQGECFAEGTVTFLVLGNVCTRNCRFCAVTKGIPQAPDEQEPKKIAEAVKRLGLTYVVITSVTRDDLPDNGANHFSKIVREVNSASPLTIVELLISDLQGSTQAITDITNSLPQVINHNIETVPRLYPAVRPKAHYQRSLEVLHTIKSINSSIVTKSGLMLGMGEDRHELLQVLVDLRKVDCDLITLGQYFPPSKSHYPLSRFVTPGEFEEIKHIALDIGFRGVLSGPFVRSSYNAYQLFQEAYHTE